VENVNALMSGQSFRKSKSSNRKLVRKRVTFEGPGAAAEVAAFGGFKLRLGGILKLLDLIREELVVEEDILWEAG